MIDFGVVKPGTTLYIPFHTFDSNDPAASVTITGLATTDIEIYKDGGTTQRASDAGYALLDTDGIDFDSITGIHGFSVDLSDNTTAGFYAAGSQYWIVVSSITVDAGTVNFVAATFRIGYQDAMLNTTIATLSSQTSFTLTDGPAEDDALNGCVVCIHDVASDVQLGFAVVSDYTGSTKTVTLTAGVTFTAAATDNISIYPPGNSKWFGQTAQTGDGTDLTEAGGTGDHLTAIPWNSAWDTEVESECNDALVAIHLDHLLAADYDPASKPGTATALLNELVENDGGVSRFTTNALEQGPSGSGSSPDHTTTIATLASQVSFTLTAGSADDDAYNGWAILITDAATSTQQALGVVSDYVGSTKTVTLDADPGIFTMATTDNVRLMPGFLTDTADVNVTQWNGSAVATPTVAGVPEVDVTYVAGVAEDIATETKQDSISTSIGNITEPHRMQNTTIATLASQTSFTLTAGSADDDAYNNCTIVITDSATSTQKAYGSISDYTGSTKTVTLSADPGIFTMAIGDTVDIMAPLGDTSSAPTAVQIRQEMDSNSTQLAAIVADTNELQTDDVPGLIAALNDISAANVNTEVLDVLNTDTFAEPSQGTPPATASLVVKIGYVYKAWRNRTTQDATTYKLYNDDGTTVDHKATVSDNGTTFDSGEKTTGP